jgi:hypothetical protein
MNWSTQLRTWMQLFEAIQTLDPRVSAYINRYPDQVSATLDDALDKLRASPDMETGSRFKWAIARLPDGRMLQGFPQHLKLWNLPIVKQGTDQDL